MARRDPFLGTTRPPSATTLALRGAPGAAPASAGFAPPSKPRNLLQQFGDVSGRVLGAAGGAIGDTAKFAASLPGPALQVAAYPFTPEPYVKTGEVAGELAGGFARSVQRPQQFGQGMYDLGSVLSGDRKVSIQPTRKDTIELVKRLQAIGTSMGMAGMLVKAFGGPAVAGATAPIPASPVRGAVGGTAKEAAVREIGKKSREVFKDILTRDEQGLAQLMANSSIEDKRLIAGFLQEQTAQGKSLNDAAKFFFRIFPKATGARPAVLPAPLGGVPPTFPNQLGNMGTAATFGGGPFSTGGMP